MTAIEAREPPLIAARRIPMGTTHLTRRLAAVGAAAAVITLSACAGNGSGDDAVDDAAAVTDGGDVASEATIGANEDAEAAGGRDAGFGVVGQEEPTAGASTRAPDASDSAGTTLQPAGQQLATEAHATLQTDDVRGAVERITTTVVTRGGRVASADIDYAPSADPADAGTSRATLVLAVPPGELAAVRSVLDDAGDVLSYDQLAEDVTDQLADLETLIANQRASI